MGTRFQLSMQHRCSISVMSHLDDFKNIRGCAQVICKYKYCTTLCKGQNALVHFGIHQDTGFKLLWILKSSGTQIQSAMALHRCGASCTKREIHGNLLQCGRRCALRPPEGGLTAQLWDRGQQGLGLHLPQLQMSPLTGQLVSSD